MIPPFYPDQARPYISENEAQSLFKRLNEIFHKTGSPFFPLTLVPFIGIVFTIWLGGVVTAVIVTTLFFSSVAIIIILRSKRKRDVTKAIEQWNRTEGVPKGIFFALGSGNEKSPDDFWLDVHSGRTRIVGNRHITTK